jgi:predicted amidophosphoribosyltransferase
LFLKDGLDECFALSLHTVLTEQGGFVRTPIGQMVREAKPYDTGWNAGSKEKAGKLAEMLSDFIRVHPTYLRAPLVAAVPPSNPNKAFELPTFLVEQIAVATGKEIVTASIRKVRTTQPMKNFATLAEKVSNIKDAFQADRAKLAEKEVILIDDIYQTGTSINEVARSLRSSGVRRALGLTMTKTIRSL